MSTIGGFKFYLDETWLPRGPEEAIFDIEDVKTWFRHFFTALHDHIHAHLTDPPCMVDWNSTKVEYIFGLSALWKEPLINDFREIVEQAGFITGPNCSIVMGLTEGEASAVSTAKNLGYRYKVMLTTCQEQHICANV